jgi:hypothetical protein
VVDTVMEDFVPKRVFMLFDVKLNPKFRRVNMRLLLLLRHGKFMSAFRALSHFTLHRRWATRAGKCSAIGYVEGEAAFWTMHDMFQLRTPSLLFSLTQQTSEILKTFLMILNRFKAEILTSLKTIKYPYSMHIKNCVCRQKTSLGREC